MITKQSLGEAWLRASPQDHRKYTERKCHACVRAGIGLIAPDRVEDAISDYFSIPWLRSKTVDFAFGQVFAAILLYGDHHRLIDELRVGPK
jgi:hypothetical protein